MKYKLNIWNRSEVFADDIKLSFVGEQAPNHGDRFANDHNRYGAYSGESAERAFEPRVSTLELKRLDRADHEQIEQNRGV